MLKRTALALIAVTLTACLSHAADLSKIPNPLDNIKQGQWVSYTAPGGMEQKQTVTDIQGTGDDRVITIKTEIIMAGNTLQAQDTTISIKDAKAQQEAAVAAGPDISITDTTINAAGKDFNAVLIESSVQGISTKIYMSKDVPVTGIVKMESSSMPDAPLMVLKDYSK